MSEKDEDLKVKEQADGSASVDLPVAEGEEDNREVEEKDNLDDNQDDQDSQDEQHDDDGDEDDPDATEAVRAARRARRKAKKEYIRRTNQEKDQKLVLLERQNQELMSRLASLEQRSSAADMARFDATISDAERRLKYAQLKLKEATDNADGDAMMKAQELYYESRRQLEALQIHKKKLVQSANQEPAVNPRVQQLATRWMEQNPWFDPNHGDIDSKIARTIDSSLAEENYDPSTPEYWEELDNRLSKRLPHIYTDNRVEQPKRRTPRSVVTGSSREAGGDSGSGRSSFVLSPERVRAIKDVGKWDDPVERAKMIKRYAEYDRSQRS